MEDPVNGVYQIENKNDLIEFAEIVNGEHDSIDQNISANAILTQDIEVISSTDTNAYTGLQQLLEGKEITDEQKTDLKKLEWTPIGNNNNNKYKGKFNGNGHTISGLYFNDTEADYVGLFGYAQNATIENIGVKNSYFKANDYVGGLIGYFDVSSEGKGEVSSSYSANCEVEGTGDYVGGLIGYFYVSSGTGKVSSSYSSDCEVTGGSNSYVGGLIGYFYNYGTGEVSSSYSKDCEVTGGSNVGGLIGRFYVGSKATGEVSSSYSKDCEVTGGSNSYVGGLIGYFYVESGRTGEVSSSYSKDCEVTGGSYVGGLIGYFGVSSGSGTGKVSSSYSAHCVVTGGSNVGGLIGYFYNYGTGEVSSCYSKDCEVTGGGGSNVGGLIGYFYVSSGTGKVSSSYSSDCEVTGGSYVGGLIGYFYVLSGTGKVSSSYSSDCEVTGGSNVGGLIGRFYVWNGETGEVKKCFYSTTQGLDGIGSLSSNLTKDVTKVGDAEFKGKSKISSGTHQDKTVLEALNEDFEDESEPFKKDDAVDQDNQNRGTDYPVHTWSNRVAYVFGSGDQTEVIKREYVHPVDNYKLTQKIKINNFEAKFDWVKTQDDLSYKVTEVKVVENESVTVFAYNTKLLKIPVRVKINYDPSNNLEKWVRDHVRHDFFRKIESGNWEKMEDTEYKFDIYTVPNSIKIGVDGTKTQDFIFSYYIFEAEDTDQFGFNKSYINVKDDSASYGMSEGNAYMTYIKQDVGGGKKLFIDYDIDPKQILENYENYNSGS